MPINQIVLPTAGGVNYSDGDVNYVQTSDAVLAENANRPLTHMVYRDTLLRDKLNEVIQAINDGGLGGAGVFSVTVNEFQPDDTNPAVNRSVGSLKAIAFSGVEDQAVLCQFTTNDMLDDTKDIALEVMYNMSSSSASKKVSLKADLWIFNEGDAPTKVANVSAEDIINCRSDQNLDVVGLTNIKIANAHLTGAGQVIALKLTRDVSTADNHAGDFQLVSIRAYQASE